MKKAALERATKNQVDDSTKYRVLQALKDMNSVWGVSRIDLMMYTGLSDRQVRKAIEELRRDGEPIGQAPQRGYTYGNQTDVNRAIGDYYAKAFSNLQIARALEGRPIEGQVKIDVTD